MTKAELEKEAEEYAIKSYGNDAFTQTHIPQMIEPVRMYLKLGYLAGAEPREKQIQIDAEQIRALQRQNGELTDKVRELEEKLEQTEKDLADYQFNYPTIKELEAQIEKMKKYAKLLQDICVVLGNDNFMVAVQLESVVKKLWDTSEEKEGLRMVEDIENRLLEIKPQEWAEITEWEIKEK